MKGKPLLKNSYDYTSYRKLVNQLVSEGKTTGPIQSQELFDFTKLNIQRMNRLDKTIAINSELSNLINQMKYEQVWAVMAEAWCGDCAQIIPVFEKIANASSGRIELLIFLSEENPAIWDRVIRSAKHAIPYLIIVDRNSDNVIGMWGSRPEPANQIMLRWKANVDTISKSDFELELHTWYSKDKTVTLQNELAQKISALELMNCENKFLAK